MSDHFITPISEEEKEERIKQEEKKKKKSKNDFSGWGIFFGVMLFAVLTTIWEMVFRDLPRFFSPYYEVCVKSGQAIAQKFCEMKMYDLIKLLLHFGFLIPLLFLLAIVYRANAGKKVNSHSRIIQLAYFFSLIVMSLHLFVEFSVFLFAYYREIGNYVVLGCIALAFTALIVYLQKRFNRPKEA